jgi:thiol:disulfide interchange protein
MHALMDRMRRPSSLLAWAVLVATVGGAASAFGGDLAERLAGLGDQGPQSDPLAAIKAELGSPVTVRATIEPGFAGAADVLAVTATLEEGWHLYSISQKPGGPRPTVIRVATDSSRQLAGTFRPDAEPHRHEVDDVPAWRGLVLEEHAGTVTWRAPLAPAAGGVSEVRGSVSLQLCRDNACVPPETIEFTAAPAAAGAVVAATHAPERSHAVVNAVLGPPRPDRGGTAWPLVVSLVPEADWHVYKPAGAAASPVGQGKPTIVAAVPPTDPAAAVAQVTAVTARPFAIPTSAELVAAGAVEGAVVLEVLLERPAAETPAVADVVIGLQTCSDSTCDPPTGVRITVALPTGADGKPTIAFEDVGYAVAGRAPLPIADPPTADAGAAAGSAVAGAAPAVPSARQSALTLPLALLMGLAGGLILNLMPCVLPVLGLKLMSFAQQSGRARREVFEMNLWYCAGLFAVFFVLATASVAANIGLAGTNLGWGQQFQFVSFRIAMLGIVFAFALSFLGVWEIPIPGFIGEQAGHVQSREGPAGSFLKGVLGTVLATPCSGPFLGPVLGFTLTQSTAVTYAVFAAIATGMALPYILVGLVPGLVRFLPRPGPWMATFKELLGFVMLGTVAYLFFMLRQQPVWFVPTFVMLIGIWMGCWWVGRLQEKQGVVGFGRWVQAAAIATAIGAAGFFWLGPHVGPGGPLIDWEQPFSARQLAAHRSNGSTVLVDFTADWCPTCKTNLATAIETGRVAAAIRRNRVVPILADFTDRSPEIDRFLTGMGSRSIPFLVIFPGTKPGETPREPIVLRDAITESQLLAALDEAGPSCCPPPEIRAASSESPPTGR